MSQLATFESLDEAAHHLYLADEVGPILCRVDGSCWLAWQDGRSTLVVDEAGDAEECIAA